MCFIRMDVPHYTCLCEDCENAELLAERLEDACKSKHIPSGPHSVVEFSSCNDSYACMTILAV